MKSCGVTVTRAREAAERTRAVVRRARPILVCAALPWRRWSHCRCVGCAETITKHGHQFQESDLHADLARHEPGAGEDQRSARPPRRRRSARAPPTTTSPAPRARRRFSRRRRRTARWWPCISARSGSVDRVAQYGLKDGKVFDYVKNETPTPAQGRGHPEGPVPQPRHQAARPRLTGRFGWAATRPVPDLSQKQSRSCTIPTLELEERQQCRRFHWRQRA